MRDFKYIVSQMHKLQNNKITQVEFEVDLTISFLREQTLEKVKLEDFGMMSHKKKLPRQEENEERRDSAT